MFYGFVLGNSNGMHVVEKQHWPTRGHTQYNLKIFHDIFVPISVMNSLNFLNTARPKTPVDLSSPLPPPRECPIR